MSPPPQNSNDARVIYYSESTKSIGETIQTVVNQMMSNPSQAQALQEMWEMKTKGGMN